MRTIYRLHPQTRKLVPVRREMGEPFPMISPDISPYRSMETGEMITSRTAHREHLKRHGLEEVGNEKPDFGSTQGECEIDKRQLREDIKEATRQVTWGEAPTLERLRDESPRWLKEMGLGE